MDFGLISTISGGTWAPLNSLQLKFPLDRHSLHFHVLNLHNCNIEWLFNYLLMDLLLESSVLSLSLEWIYFSSVHLLVLSFLVPFSLPFRFADSKGWGLQDSSQGIYLVFQLTHPFFSSLLNTCTLNSDRDFTLCHFISTS